MFSGFERFVAFRYLRPRRKEGFISIVAFFAALGIALGVFVLIAVMAVMNGYRHEIVSQFLGMGGHLSVVGIGGRPIEQYESLGETLSDASGVTGVMPVIEKEALVTINGGSAFGAAVHGVPPADFLSRPAVAERLEIGAVEDFSGTEVVAIGRRMASRYGLRIGDDVTLVSPQLNATAFGGIPRTRAYEIAAIFEVGINQYDSAVVYMPIESAQVLYRLPEAVTGIHVFVDDPDDMALTRTDILRQLLPGLGLFDWQQANSSIITALRVEQVVMFMILTLIVLVATFNIIAGLVVLVNSKGQDIAILRTMGASRGTIMRIFVLTGATIGVIGVVLGILLALLFVRNIEPIQIWLSGLLGFALWDPVVRFLTEMPARIDWGEFTAVVVISLLLSFLVTLYPSWRAARLDPVEALRYE